MAVTTPTLSIEFESLAQAIQWGTPRNFTTPDIALSALSVDPNNPLKLKYEWVDNGDGTFS